VDSASPIRVKRAPPWRPPSATDSPSGAPDSIFARSAPGRRLHGSEHDRRMPRGAPPRARPPAPQTPARRTRVAGSSRRLRRSPGSRWRRLGCLKRCAKLTSRSSVIQRFSTVGVGVARRNAARCTEQPRHPSRCFPTSYAERSEQSRGDGRASVVMTCAPSAEGPMYPPSRASRAPSTRRSHDSRARSPNCTPRN